MRGNSNAHALVSEQDAETKRDDETMNVFLTVATEARDQNNSKFVRRQQYMDLEIVPDDQKGQMRSRDMRPANHQRTFHPSRQPANKLTN
jgi:hypothetical protein